MQRKKIVKYNLRSVYSNILESVDIPWECLVKLSFSQKILALKLCRIKNTLSFTLYIQPLAEEFPGHQVLLCYNLYILADCIVFYFGRWILSVDVFCVLLSKLCLKIF